MLSILLCYLLRLFLNLFVLYAILTGFIRQCCFDLCSHYDSSSLLMDCRLVVFDNETNLEVQTSGYDWKERCEISSKHKTFK